MSTLKNKNFRAASYTFLVLTLLFLLFFFVSWAPPSPTLVPKNEDMEVALEDAPEGMSGENSGSITNANPPAPEQLPTPITTEKSIETNDADKEAPAVVSKTKAVVKKVVPIEKAIPPTPKYIYNGPGAASKTQTPSTGGAVGEKSGGNSVGNGEGLGGGTGDKGLGIGSGGLSVVRGLQGRKISKYPSFEDEFNENAKVAVDVRVDQFGNVVGVNIQPRGTTTGNSAIKNIALQKAKLLKFTSNNDAADEEIGTVVFVFRVKD